MGIKEDLSISNPTPPGGSNAFARILQRAAESTSSGPLKPTPGTPGALPGEGGDAVNFLALLGQAGASPKDAKSSLEADLDNKADLTAVPGLVPAQGEALPLGKVPNPTLNPFVPTEPLATVHSMDNGTTIQEQIGQAAYRMGSHGATEGTAAQQAGLGLETLSPGQAMAQSGAAVFTEAQVKDPQTGKDGQSPELAQAVSEGEQRELDLAEQRVQRNQNLEAALGRDRLLSQVAAAAMASASAKDGVLGEAERGKLQLNGLLARNLRAVSGELTSPGLNPAAHPAQVGTYAGPSNPAMLYDTGLGARAEARLTEQVATKAKWLIEGERNEVTFRLKPEHLGAMNLRVTEEDGVLRVHMSVETLQAKQMLESNLNALRDQLMEQNPNGEFEFDVDVQQGNENHRENFAESAQDSRARLSDRMETVGEAPVMPRRVFSPSGVSIFA